MNMLRTHSNTERKKTNKTNGLPDRRFCFFFKFCIYDASRWLVKYPCVSTWCVCVIVFVVSIATAHIISFRVFFFFSCIVWGLCMGSFRFFFSSFLLVFASFVATHHSYRPSYNFIYLFVSLCFDVKASCPRAAELPPIKFSRNVCFDLLNNKKLLPFFGRIFGVFFSAFCLRLTVDRFKCLCVCVNCVQKVRNYRRRWKCCCWIGI